MILMAYGEAKAEAIKGMIDGPVTTDMPQVHYKTIKMLL